MTDSTQKNSDIPMVFVTGASRSGTTMLSRMFGQHSQVSGFKELHCYGDLVDPNNLNAVPDEQESIDLVARLIASSKRDIWGAVEPGDIEEATSLLGDAPEGLSAGELAALTFEYLAKQQDKRIPCEQTPRNIFYAKQLLDFYPNLKIVHIVRDPRDVLASQKNRWKRKKFGGDNVPYSEIFRVWCNYHPHTITKLWKQANKLALELKGHERFYILRFEDVISNPEATVRAAAEFAGLEYEPEMLQIAQVGSSHKTNADSTLGVAKIALDRWKQVLAPGEINICEKVANGGMDDFAYPRSEPASQFSLSLLAQFIKYPLHLVGVVASNPRRAWILLKAVVVKAK